MRLGLKSAEQHPGAQRLGATLDLECLLAKVPATCDWQAILRLDSASPDALGNDRYGDCVEAGNLRQVQMREANAMGSGWVPSAAEALALYASWSGFNPQTGQPDDGTELARAQALAAQVGIRIGTSDLDVPLPVTVRPGCLNAATWLFGSVGLCWALPAALQDGNLREWDVATGAGSEPGSWGLHYTCSGAYTPGERKIITWGLEATVTPAFEAKYLVSACAGLSRRWFDARGLTPPGLSWSELEAARGQL